jgi:hypothetical protein
MQHSHIVVGAKTIVHAVKCKKQVSSHWMMVILSVVGNRKMTEYSISTYRTCMI